MAIVSKQCWTKFTVNNKINSSWLQYFIFVLTDEFPISESGVAFETLPSFKFYFEIQFRMQTVSGSIPWVRHCVAWDQTTSARAPGVSKLIITPHSNHIKCDVQAHIRLPLDEYLWNSTLGFDLNQSDESCCWNHWLVVCGPWGSVLASLHTCCLALILRMSSRPGKMRRGVATWLKKFCNVGRGGVLEKINGLIRP